MKQIMGRRCSTKNRFNPSDFNRRISIERLVQTKDAEGGMVDSWVEKLKMSVRVNNLSPRYGIESALTSHGGQVSSARTEFEGHFVAGINTLDRVLYNGKKYNITHVNDYYEQHRYVILTCSEGVNDGR